MQSGDPRVIYGVYEVPTYMSDARQIDSTWDSERRAIERARQRSVQVHGRVFVLTWTLNSPGGQAVATFIDGERTDAADSEIPVLTTEMVRDSLDQVRR